MTPGIEIISTVSAHAGCGTVGLVDERFDSVTESDQRNAVSAGRHYRDTQYTFEETDDAHDQKQFIFDLDSTVRGEGLRQAVLCLQGAVFLAEESTHPRNQVPSDEVQMHDGVQGTELGRMRRQTIDDAIGSFENLGVPY